ncbi:MAG: RimK family alpha-L-glutamate ligase, partial [Bacteroidota bacterium]
FSRGPNLYSTLRLVEAGKARGHKMSIIDHGACSFMIHEQGSDFFLRGNPIHKPDVIIPRIGASVTALGAATISQLDLMGIPHLTSVEGLLLARDKMRCLQFLATKGIDVPNTLLCSSAAESRRVARRIGNYPVIVKLLESTHGVGVSLVNNRFQLERTAEAYIQLQNRVIVQEYIAEAAGADIRAFVVDGKIVAAMQRQASKGEFRANMHRGATATAIKLTPEEAFIAKRTAELMQLDVVGVDLIRSHRGPLIMEVNASPGLEGIEKCTGVDVASHIISAAEARLSQLP